jgi:hypothetical protein
MLDGMIEALDPYLMKCYARVGRIPYYPSEESQDTEKR